MSPSLGLFTAGGVVTSEVQSHDVTQLLIQWSHGDEGALTALTPLVYDELHRVARSYMRRENPGHTLQSTALVHEAFVRLVDQRVAWNSRAHFFGIAAQMMRRILVDHAKAKATAKRGSGAPRLELDEHLAASPKRDVDLVALDEALERLSQIDPQRARIVELRFFGGLSNEESALLLGISQATVQRQWAGARAWLFKELSQK